jgi:hypothetical protein
MASNKDNLPKGNAFRPGGYLGTGRNGAIVNVYGGIN